MSFGTNSPQRLIVPWKQSKPQADVLAPQQNVAARKSHIIVAEASQTQAKLCTNDGLDIVKYCIVDDTEA